MVGVCRGNRSKGEHGNFRNLWELYVRKIKGNEMQTFHKQEFLKIACDGPGHDLAEKASSPSMKDDLLN